MAQWLHRQEKPLNLDEILPILQQTALALNAMHRLEMLHQDIRPNNIIVLNTESAMKIKLIDYGSTAVRGLVEINPKMRIDHSEPWHLWHRSILLIIRHLYIQTNFLWR